MLLSVTLRPALHLPHLMRPLPNPVFTVAWSATPVEGDKIKLAKSDSADGHHHIVNVADVADIKNDEIRLSKNRT